MSGALTVESLMSKAVRACASARALLDLDDVDGACNRAYYAMLGLSGGARELPPCAPTEPYVKVTPHTALRLTCGWRENFPPSALSGTLTMW